MKKAFTLVELLAVIVILAIILIIAVPQIMDTIEKSRKSSFEATAKLLADAAEKQYTTEQTLGKNVTSWETGIDCKNASWSGIENTNDYNTCTVKIVNETAYVTITGNGKFDKYLAKDATKTEAETIKGILGQITSKNTANNADGLFTDPYGNIRYTGANPNNYVIFNNETWRIIGIVDGNVKIIRNNSLGFYVFYSPYEPHSGVESTYGINDWNSSDLAYVLNDLYYNKKSSTCYRTYNSATKTDCDFTTIGLSELAKNMIQEVTWYTGASVYSNLDVPWELSLNYQYEKERGNLTGTAVNGITRTSRWTGKVGVPYLSDFGYASLNSECRENLRAGVVYDGTNWIYTNAKCGIDNWLHLQGYSYWTLSSAYTNSYVVFPSVFGDFTATATASTTGATYPSVYLKPSVIIQSGTGTSTDPYILKN